MQDRTSVRHVEENFLSLKYEKKVSIVRIIDSRNEKFRLRAEYRDRYNEIITINTRPEIEILLIIKNGDYDDYCKVRSQEKASSYCMRKYGYRKNRDRFMDFITPEELVDSIRSYRSMHSKECTLFSLLKESKQ